MPEWDLPKLGARTTSLLHHLPDRRDDKTLKSHLDRSGSSPRMFAFVVGI
jgi:hypothetical protein